MSLSAVALFWPGHAPAGKRLPACGLVALGGLSNLTVPQLIAHVRALGIGGRSTDYGVGKTMGSRTWVHRRYESVFPARALAAAKRRLPKGFAYDIVRYDSKSGEFSFIQSPDFDRADEPTVGDSWNIGADGQAVLTRQAADPLIYHHKWAFVGDDYDGFDVAQSLRHSARWKSIVGVDAAVSSRIGRRSFWESEVVPKLTQTSPELHPEKTQMSIRTPSLGARKTAQWLKEAGARRVLDFGAGNGRNSVFLADAGYRVDAYDPSPNAHSLFDVRSTYRKDAKYDAVLSSYVLNVLPPAQRLAAAKELDALNWDSLILEVRAAGEVDKKARRHGWPKLEDGYLSSPAKGTFQAGLTVDDLKKLPLRWRGYEVLADSNDGVVVRFYR